MIRNASFETQELGLQTGVAQYWSSDSLGTGEESASFNGDLAAAPSARESFEAGWGLLDPQHLVASLEAVVSLEPETMSGWAVNQAAIAIGGAEAATFDSHTTATETFDLWAMNIDRDFSFDTAEVASAAREDFEWNASVTVLAAVQTASFNTAAQTATVEEFLVRLPQVVHVDSTAHRLKRTDGGNFVGAVDELVTLSTDGQLPAAFLEGAHYYVRSTAGAVVELALAPSAAGGDALVPNDSGTGIHSISADPQQFWITEESI